MKKTIAIVLIVWGLIWITPSVSFCYWTPGWSDFWDWITTDPHDEGPNPE